MGEIAAAVSSFSIKPRSADKAIGRWLKMFLPFWRRVTDDPFVLRAILGVQFTFVRPPQPMVISHTFRFSQSDHEAIAQFVQKLLITQVVVPVLVSPDQVVSPVFLTTNRDGTKRMILNVKTFNRLYIKPLHFKMENLPKILPLIRHGQWLTSWDVVQGYYNVRLHPDMMRFFCFDFDGVRYLFRALVMGSSDAPRIFTRIMQTLVQMARMAGILVFSYIDDTLLVSDSFEEAERDSRVFGELLQRAGFFLHPDKSVHVPTQQLRFLGFIIDTRTLCLTLPEEKETRLHAAIEFEIARVWSGDKLSVCDVAKFVGFLMSCIPATVYGKAYYRRLERAWDEQLRFSRDYNRSMRWSDFVLPDLLWWCALPSPISASFAKHQFSCKLYTDALLDGWGAICAQHTVFGVWRPEEVDCIAVLELKAVWMALITLPVSWVGSLILLRIDNQVGQAYLNNRGGRIERLNFWATRIWDFLEERRVLLQATYVRSEHNPADRFTRLFSRVAVHFLDVECQLNPAVFEWLLSVSDWVLACDWFDSLDNAQLPLFCSWLPSTRATFFDAFAQDWGGLDGYAFLPFALLLRVLHKIRTDTARMILVHPAWPGALWYPELKRLAVRTRTIRSRPDLLLYPNFPGLCHPTPSLPLQASWFGR